MKKIWKIFLGIEFGFFVLLLILAIITIVLKAKWIAFWIFFSILTLISIIGLIYIVVKLKSKIKTKLEEINSKDAVERVIKYVKEESQNPDNYKMTEVKKINIGQGTPTPTLVIDGKGIELGERRVILFNTINGSISEMKPNIENEELKEAIRLFPDFPEDYYESTKTEIGQYGNTVITTRSQKTYKEKQEEMEQKEADDKNII